jgi:hypothetical protein
MPPINTGASDAMISRLQNELEERNSYVQGLIAGAQDKERDLTEAEKASSPRRAAGSRASTSSSRP